MTPLAPDVAVVGAGTLGLTVARSALLAGSRVRLMVRGGPGRERSHIEQIRISLEHRVRKGRITPELAADCLARLETIGGLPGVAGADVVLESVPEHLALKRHVIDLIEQHAEPSAVIASTTSSLPAEWIARDARHPERIVVAHYVWPADRIPLVEVALHPGTSPAAARTLSSLLAGQGKTVLKVADRPGFLITRALFAYWDATAELLLRDRVRPADVDAALERFGWPMGPVRVMEATGLDCVARVYSTVSDYLTGLPWLGELCRLTERIAAVRDVAADPVHIVDVVEEFRGCSVRRDALGDAAIVERTVGALATEVDVAVAEGLVDSWDEGGAAVDLAYGFPQQHVGLQHWWYSHTSQLSDRPLSIARS